MQKKTNQKIIYNIDDTIKQLDNKAIYTEYHNSGVEKGNIMNDLGMMYKKLYNIQ
jgi:hypothetical protein